MDVLEWLQTIPEEISSLKKRAVVGGEEDGSPVWVIRANVHNDVVPGKLLVNSHEAYVSWGGKQHNVLEIEVACADAKKITWLPGSNGSVPSNAIVAGYVRGTGEQLYVGKGQYMGQVICGKIEQSRKVLSITYSDEVVSLVNYDVLCTATSE